MSKKTQIGGVMFSDNLVLIGILAMPSKPGTAGQIMRAMGIHDINVEFITQTTGLTGKDHVIFCVKEEDGDRILTVLDDLRDELGSEKIVQKKDVGIVFTFGPDFRYLPGIAGEVFETLGEASINIIAISTSISTISCVVEGEQLQRAIAALERRFETP